MSRVGQTPVEVPSGVEVKIDAQHVAVKGTKGTLEIDVHESVGVVQKDSQVLFSDLTNGGVGHAMSGTMRSLVNNMVLGVSKGFDRRLELQGVGYRAQAQGQKLNLTLGFSHPVVYQLPDGINVETPSQTEIVVSGIDKQLVGQVSAEIRSFRPPEPYKGKGVRYADEHVRRKEAKKK